MRGCCSIGCHTSVKNALALKSIDEEVDVRILYRDLSMVKDEQVHIRRAKSSGVKFIRFPDAQYPEVKSNGEGLSVMVHDLLLDRDFALDADLVVLTVGFTGDESVAHVRGLFKVSSNSEGFFSGTAHQTGPPGFSRRRRIPLRLCQESQDPEGNL